MNYHMTSLHFKRLSQLATCGLLVTWSMAQVSCVSSKQPAVYFKNYQTRLARVLSIDVATVASSPLVAASELGVTVPRKRDRTLPSKENTLNFFDFLRLDNCKVKQLVAQRNNQLGQHMQAANGIVYEVAIRHALQHCTPHESSDALKAQLKAAQHMKENAIVSDFWQYTFGAEWFGRYASTSVQPLAWDDTETLLASEQAWQLLNEVLLAALQKGTINQSDTRLKHTSDTSASVKTASVKTTSMKTKLNQALATLETSQAFGKLHVSLIVAINELNRTNQILRKASPNVLCARNAAGKRIKTKELDYFQNVVAQYFAKDIQVYLARLSRGGQGLRANHAALMQAFQAQINQLHPDAKKSLGHHISAFEGYLLKTQALDSLYQQSVREHVKHIQNVSTICDKK